MKKLPLFVALVLIFSAGLSSCGQSGSPSGNGADENTGSIENSEGNDGTGASLEDRMDMARKRVALRSIIRKGDYYRARNDAEAAIRYYKNAHDKIQGDANIALKLADSYYELKRYDEAYELYKTLPVKELDEKTKLKFIGSIMLDDNRKDRAAEVAKYPFEQGTKDYYSLVDACVNDAEKCSEKISASQSKDPRIQALAETVRSYNQLSNDTAYRDALLAGKFYEQQSYLASKTIAAKALARRPDYRIMLKIGGYSEYALGNFKESSVLLEKYYSLEPKDIETAYMLGIVNYLKEDYSTSNLYFNAAVLNGYSPKTELERRLIYNYTLLWDARGAYKIFRYLLDEPDVTSEDYEIAIFMAIEWGEPSKAALWSQKWLLKFPEDDRLLAFAGGLKIRTGDYEEAETLLRKALSIEARNPVALLELGRLFIAKNDYTLAEGYLKDAVEADNWGYFGSEAQKELDIVAKMATNSGATASVENTVSQ